MEVEVENEAVEIETDVTVTVHCVGVFLPCETIGPALLMMSCDREKGLYCVPLKKDTAFLVSPLYKHILVLHGDPQDVDMSLALFVGERPFTVKERVECEYRLDPAYNPNELKKKLKELFTQSLFIEMNTRYTALIHPNHLLKPLFTNDGAVKQRSIRYAFLDCNISADKSIIHNFLTIHKTQREKKGGVRGSKDTFYTKCWKDVQSRRTKEQKAEIDRAVEDLTRYFHKTQDQIYHKGHILAFLKDWKAYSAISHYFIYRIPGIEYIYFFDKLIQGRHRSTLLPLIGTMSHANQVALHNLCTFIIEHLLAAPIQSPIRIIRTDIPIALLDDVIFSGHVVSLLESLCRENVHTKEIRTSVRRSLLAYLVLLKLELKAIASAPYTKATVEPLTTYKIHAVYQSLITTLKEQPQLVEPVSYNMLFSLDEQLEDEFHAVLLVLKDTVRHDTGYKPQENTLLPTVKHWHIKEGQNIANSKTVLFFYAHDLSLLTLEAQNHFLTDKYVLGKAYTAFHTQYDAKTATSFSEESWQDEWATLKESTNDGDGLQQYQCVLFSPSQITHNEDLVCIKTLLFADLHNTVILREVSDMFFHNRLALYFDQTQTELDMELFHSKYCFELSQFDRLPEKALKETLIIPQCHTLSLIALQNLIKLIVYYQKTVKRIVLIGSLTLLPLDTPAQAFVDFVRTICVQETSIVHLLYDRTVLPKEFSMIVNKQWRIIKCENERQIASAKQLVTHYREGKYAVLYQLAKEELVQYLLPAGEKRIGSTTPLIVCCLTKGKTPNYLFTSMSSKEKSKNTFEQMEIGMLARHDFILKPNTLFVISKKVLLTQLDQNELIHLFMLVDNLYVIDCDGKKDLLECLIALVREKCRNPNLRYSHIALTK